MIMSNEKVPNSPKNVKVQRRAKTERRYTPVADVLDLCRVIEGHGDRIAYTYFDKSRNLHDMTYGELGRLIKEVAAGITEIGLAGKRIAVIGETSVEWVASYMAILASGGVAIPMDKELQISEIEGFLESVDASAVIYSA